MNRKGFYFDGYGIDGYDKDGYNKEGRDKEGYDRYGYDKEGYDRGGYDKDGYNKRGFNREGINIDTKGEYDPDGYDKDGYDKDGYNKEGRDKTGKNREERAEIEQIRRKNWLGLRGKAEKLAKGEMTIEEYILKSKTSIEDLIKFAKKENMSADIIRKLHRFVQPYKRYTRPFNKKEYLSSTILAIGDKEIKPTEQDVNKCIAYLKGQGLLICDKTVRTTIISYLKGELDITLKGKLEQAKDERNAAKSKNNEIRLKEKALEEQKKRGESYER